MRKSKTKYVLPCALCALIIAVSSVSLTSCGKKNTESSAKDSSVSKSDNSSQNSKADSSDSSTDSGKADSSSTAEVVQGEKIKKAYEYFNSSEYSFRERIIDGSGKVKSVVETRKGDNFYHSQESDYGVSGKIKVGKDSFNFDGECGIYSKADDKLPENMIKSVVEKKLPQTSTHINENDAKKYDIEEYTYTGSTYITVLDFCFDKKSGQLVKYTVTYQVEGKDNETETREFVYMKDKAEEKLLDLSFIHNLTNFDNLTGDERADFCRLIIDKKKINSDSMIKQGMTTEKLKTISYDEFTEFVYTSIKQNEKNQ